jgi:hypothetical protein
MPSSSLQDLCELGSEQLIETRYLEAEATLARAEAEAWTARDWDTLARLYMPLQEARRQRRQRCGEGIVALDLIAAGPDDELDGRRVVENFPHGQLLVAGWKTIEPAIMVRKLAAEHALYAETFLAAVYPVRGQPVVAVVGLEDSQLPQGEFDDVATLRSALPAHSLVFEHKNITQGQRRGPPATFGEVMLIWEQLHKPFLAEADAQSGLIQKIEGYRRTARVDYACELAHQKLSTAAHELARQARQQRRA